MDQTDKRVFAIQSLKDSFLAAVKKWQFIGHLFYSARGRFDGPFLMPILWAHVFDHGDIPSTQEIVAQLGESSRPWVYQARSGLIREIHVALYLAHFGAVTKNYSEDIFNGIDLRYNGKALAIRHDGDFSDQVWKERKEAKSAGCIVLNARGQGAGIHLVRLEEINAKVLAL